MLSSRACRSYNLRIGKGLTWSSLQKTWKLMRSLKVCPLGGLEESRGRSEDRHVQQRASSERIY